jgi:hypothetical protein
MLGPVENALVIVNAAANPKTSLEHPVI